ncbi:Zinc finger, HIT-type [Penicillium italicum]|uniref:Zinc finger, HIT-type n=1 Tax=Penicillium italicum TaxID=40296 RepID=A0A0A2L6Q4_PENIT|nr:Zinc finger, HIT-type [Penicillium italicum]
MFRVELVSDTSTATPGWSYAPTRGFNPTQAMAPTLGRKRGIRDAGKGGDISSRQANAIARHIAELDRENQRDVSIPAPVKQAREAGARGTRAKTTSNVRRILQSQKTFRNHLDDEEAAIASGSGGVAGMQGAGGPSIVAAKGGKAAAVRRSATPASTAGVKRPLAAVAGTTTAVSTPAQETTDGETDVDDEPLRKPKLIKSEHDNDPLLRSYAPPVPSDRIMQRLLAELPLSYNASRAKPPASGRPGRHFCCLCGYWGKIRCKSCHLRTCGLDCYKVHEDSRCGAFF